MEAILKLCTFPFPASENSVAKSNLEKIGRWGEA